MKWVGARSCALPKVGEKRAQNGEKRAQNGEGLRKRELKTVKVIPRCLYIAAS